MRVVIAPDSFKGSLRAPAVAAALARGWRSVRPDDELVPLPQADGGEGTLQVLEAALPGARRRDAGTVTGPDGRPVTGSWLELADGTAVVELAEVAGLELMAELDPLGASSRGLGETIAAALDAGASRLVVALGGSASTDGGEPMLAALGARTPPPGGAVALTDVTAPLLGERGAAAVFGPQKGASPAQVAELDARLAAIAAAHPEVDAETPGAGAAGGVGYGLLRWGAALASGADEVARLTGLVAAEREADVVLTGEGRFDAQSLTGKVVGAMIARGVTPWIVAGAIETATPGPAFELRELAGSSTAALAEPERWLEAAGAEAARAAG
ncbi:MAG: glycerate kinase [Actinomycetales bacterium]|nr:glycerate kinase [Actinomycetales bacterium]